MTAVRYWYKGYFVAATSTMGAVKIWQGQGDQHLAACHFNFAPTGIKIGLGFSAYWQIPLRLLLDKSC